MRNLSNIEKSGFRSGEYVGYANGVWRITRGSTGKGWLARNGVLTRHGRTLAELSDKLKDYARAA